MRDLDTLAAAARLDAWIEREGFTGWDPHDALNSPLLKRLSFGNRRLGIAWLQLVKRSPFNLRPGLGVPKGCNPKGMGLFLASYPRKQRRPHRARMGRRLGRETVERPPVPHSGGLLIARDFMPFAAQRGLRPFLLGLPPMSSQRWSIGFALTTRPCEWPGSMMAI